MAAGVTFGDQPAVRAVVVLLRQSAGARGDDRRRAGERLEREVREAVYVAGVVAHRRHGDEVGGRRQPRDVRL